MTRRGSSIVVCLSAASALLVSLPFAAGDHAQTKVKIKDDTTVVSDKSKPVRQAIEAWYSRNIEAFDKKDVAAIMALRTEDFYTLTPDGKVNPRADMETRTRQFIDRIDHFLVQDFKIGTIEVVDDLASADIHQRTVRMQRYPDGTLHKVDASVVQRETWKLMPEGWMLYKVDNIRDSVLLVDDAPFRPNL